MTASNTGTPNMGSNPASNPTLNTGSSPGSTPASSSGSNSGTYSGSTQRADPGSSQAAADYGHEQSSQATAKLASAAHTAVEVAAQNLAHTEKVLREAGVSAGAKVSDSARQVFDSSEDALASIKDYIDQYPLRSVGIALAAGFLLSSVLKR